MITSEEFQEVLQHLIEVVQLTGMPCAIIGDNERGIVYGFVMGTMSMTAAAVDEIGMPEAEIISVLKREERDDDEYEGGQLH